MHEAKRFEEQGVIIVLRLLFRLPARRRGFGASIFEHFSTSGGLGASILEYFRREEASKPAFSTIFDARRLRSEVFRAPQLQNHHGARLHCTILCIDTSGDPCIEYTKNSKKPKKAKKTKISKIHRGNTTAEQQNTQYRHTTHKKWGSVGHAASTRSSRRVACSRCP